METADRQPDIFISYSSKDKTIADAVCDYLEKRGIDCWIAPRDVRPGFRYGGEIVKAIKSCKITILIFSGHSNDSEDVANEIHRAFVNKKTIIPFKIEEVSICDDLDYYLSNKHWVDASSNPAGYFDYLYNNCSKFIAAYAGILPEVPVASAKAEDYIERQAEKLRIAEAKRKKEEEKAERIKRAKEKEKKKEEEKRRREAEAAAKREEEERLVALAGEMVFVESGTFTMGATPEQGSNAANDEKPIHKVTLDSFYIGKYPVTQKQWKTVMEDNPAFFEGDDYPVESVNWIDVQKFISKLNELTGKNFRLPTEAEWEYAARGGKRSRGFKYSGSDSLYDVGWFRDNSDKKITHPIGLLKGNELEIYDISGNVWEWCSDYYSSTYYSESPDQNPQGPFSGTCRVFRGGSWYYDANHSRISYRNYRNPESSYDDLGFRLALSA